MEHFARSSFASDEEKSWYRSIKRARNLPTGHLDHCLWNSTWPRSLDQESQMRPTVAVSEPLRDARLVTPWSSKVARLTDLRDKST